MIFLFVLMKVFGYYGWRYYKPISVATVRYGFSTTFTQPSSLLSMSS